MKIYDLWTQAKEIREEATKYPTVFGRNINHSLVALPENPNPEDVNAIFAEHGTSEFIRIRCELCKEVVSRVVRLGNEYQTMDICGACLLQSLQLHDE